MPIDYTSTPQFTDIPQSAYVAYKEISYRNPYLKDYPLSNGFYISYDEESNSPISVYEMELNSQNNDSNGNSLNESLNDDVENSNKPTTNIQPNPPINNSQGNESSSNGTAKQVIIGGSEYQLEKEFNPQAIWGPIAARLIPDTKHTLAKVVSRNISSLSKDEYKRMRELMEFIATHPEIKARVFELTGFNDRDLEFAEPYFRKYNTRKFFSKLVEIALSTSSHGKVSKQVSGLVQFIFETQEINGQPVSDDFKFLFLRGLPNLVESSWSRFAIDCQNKNGQNENNLCTNEYKSFLDLNGDNNLDNQDFQLANSSINWLKANGLY